MEVEEVEKVVVRWSVLVASVDGGDGGSMMWSGMFDVGWDGQFLVFCHEGQVLGFHRGRGWCLMAVMGMRPAGQCPTLDCSLEHFRKAAQCQVWSSRRAESSPLSARQS